MYDDTTLPTTSLNVSFVGEMGSDLGGLTKELFTLTWREVLNSFFKGEEAMVPYVPLHRTEFAKQEFIIIGRILAHSASLLQMIPPRMSRTTLLQLVFGSDADIDKELLLEDFRSVSFL